MRRAVLFLLLLPAAARGADVLAWQDAAKHVGEQATVEGVVAAVHCSPLACSLAFEPTFTRFTAIVQAERFDVFPPSELEPRYKGRRVRLSGTIETIDGKPRMQIASPESLTLAPEAKSPNAPAAAKDDTRGEPGGAAVGAAEAEVLDRLEEILERLETLSERLAAAEERMAGLMGYLDERERGLAAAAQMSPAPLPPLRPAPAAQALRSLKRGMSAGDVERLAGRPLGVIDSGNGWTTWDYGGGRVITFDARGRAQSLTGFGAP
jgi:hypothetical protein